MELQMTFAELEYDSKKRRTRREIPHLFNGGLDDIPHRLLRATAPHQPDHDSDTSALKTVPFQKRPVGIGDVSLAQLGDGIGAGEGGASVLVCEAALRVR